MSVTIGPYTFDRVHYDTDADVLYLHVGDPSSAVHFDETPDGDHLRFEEHGRLVGLTLIGLRRRLAETPGADLTVMLPVPVAARTADLKLAVA